LKIKGEKGVGSFIERPNRFTVIVETEAGLRIYHLRDPGRLTELLKPGAKVMFLESRCEGRKTDCEVPAVHDGLLWTVVNSGIHNKLAEKLVIKGLIPEIKAESTIEREVSYGNSRIDLMIHGSPHTGGGQGMYPSQG